MRLKKWELHELPYKDIVKSGTFRLTSSHSEELVLRGKLVQECRYVDYLKPTCVLVWCRYHLYLLNFRFVSPFLTVTIVLWPYHL